MSTAQKNVDKITYQDLSPGDLFWITCESCYSKVSPWELQVLEILKEVAKVMVIFPQTGHREVAYLEKATIGKPLRVYYDPNKNSYSMGNNIVDIRVM